VNKKESFKGVNKRIKPLSSPENGIKGGRLQAEGFEKKGSFQGNGGVFKRELGNEDVGTKSPNPLYQGGYQWERVKAVAEKCYGGRFLEKVEISLGGGYEHREFESAIRNAPYGELKVSVPLFSRETAQKRAEAKRAFLKEASGYLQEIEEGKRLVEVIKEEARIKKEILTKCDGSPETSGDLKDQEERISAYLELSERIVTVQAEMKNAERKLEAMIGEGASH
jgi:hypothetical protein